jgi:hypothetical protein
VPAVRGAASAAVRLRIASLTSVLLVAGCLVVVSGIARGGAAGAVGASVLPEQAPGSYQPVPPRRVVDTRIGLGVRKGLLPAHATVVFQMAGRDGVPAASVSAVALTVTVVQPVAAGYLTAYAAARARPTVSMMNFLARATRSNTTIVPVTSTGKIAVYNGAPGPTQLVVEVAGYYLGGAVVDDGGYVPVGPKRVLDTRSGLGAARGSLAPGQSLKVWPGSSIPDGARNLVLNVAVVHPSAAGSLTAWPDLLPRPSSSAVRFAAGPTVSNLVIVRVGDSALFDFYNGSAGRVDVVADVLGYFGWAGSATHAGLLTAVTSARLLDTRTGLGAPRSAVAAGHSVTLQVTGRGGVHATRLRAAMLAVTVVTPRNTGQLAIYADGATRPGVRQVNFPAAQTTTTMVIVPVGPDGKIVLFNNSTSPVQLAGDVTGYIVDDGAFAGTVTDTAGHPIRGVHVRVDSGVPIADAVTDALGRYLVTGLTGGYRVCFDGRAGVGASSQLGYTSTCPSSGYFIDVGKLSSGNNVQLEPTGVMTGRVTDPAGNPLASVSVFVDHNLATTTDTAGTYEVRQLTTGLHHICFSGGWASGSTSATGYGAACLDNDVAVTANTTTGGIDQVLEIAGIIAGIVRDSAGNPVPHVGVRAWGPSGSAGGTSDATGAYAIRTLLPGTYSVLTVDGVVGGPIATYSKQFFDGVRMTGTPTPVVVTAGSVTPNIDFHLVHTGGIRGVVRDAQGRPVSTALITFMYATHDGDATPTAQAYTTATGEYQADHLSEADYAVCASLPGHPVACYDHASTVDAATDVQVRADEITPGIDITLD